MPGQALTWDIQPQVGRALGQGGEGTGQRRTQTGMTSLTQDEAQPMSLRERKKCLAQTTIEIEPVIYR